MAKYCRVCGNALNGKTRCDRCGAIVVEQNTQPVPLYNYQQYNQQKQASGSGTKIITVLLAILLIVIIVFCVSIGMKLLLADDVVKDKTQTEQNETYPGNERTKEYKQSDGYLFPSHIKRITENDLMMRSQYEVALIRNEIYARHGYVFQTKEYADYFSSKSWYVPRADFNESMLNEIEKYNKDFIVEYETKRGWR